MKESPALPADLVAARRRFEKWRAGGRARRRLPPELWQLAADLVPAHGIHRVSQVLRLEYYKVREQAEQRRTVKPPRRALATRQAAAIPPPALAKRAFVEVVPQPGLSASHEIVVELADSKGRRMSIRSRVALDVVALVNTFCGGAP